jgi:hypothetical protein
MGPSDRPHCLLLLPGLVFLATVTATVLLLSSPVPASELCQAEWRWENPLP